MQDLRTGELKELPLSDEILRRFEADLRAGKLSHTAADADVVARFKALPARQQREVLQAAADRVIPDRRHQGPVFLVGEELEIRGGKFRVLSLNPKRGTITFESLPR